MKQFKAEKLIRDKLPEILKAKGITANYEIVDGQKYIQVLQAKLLEEASEMIESANTNELVAEMADILEVMHAFCKINNISFEQVEQARVEKHSQRGGFERGVYCQTISMEDDNSLVEYYQSKPDEYPAIK